MTDATITAADLTDSMIRDLRDEAVQAGDLITADDCRDALYLDPAADDVSSARLVARTRIAKVISRARAMEST